MLKFKYSWFEFQHISRRFQDLGHFAGLFPGSEISSLRIQVLQGLSKEVYEQKLLF